MSLYYIKRNFYVIAASYNDLRTCKNEKNKKNNENEIFFKLIKKCVKIVCCDLSWNQCRTVATNENSLHFRWKKKYKIHKTLAISCLLMFGNGLN